MKHKTKATEWALDCLGQAGYKIIYPPEMVIATPWSTVIRFWTKSDCFYLKQTPADLFIETAIIKLIQASINGACIPTICFENQTLYSFITKSCGEQSLRTLFAGKINEPLLISGLQVYTHIMRSAEQNLYLFERIGVPAWRLKQIPALYQALLAQKTVLLTEGLVQTELDQLMALVPTIELMCDALAQEGIAETLVNVDFNENNLIIDTKTQKVTVIDWGESVISHPFFSLASHLKSLARRYNISMDGAVIQTIKQKFLTAWLDVSNMSELNSIYDRILKIHPIFCALGLYRLQVATNNQSKKMQNWFIAQSLRDLLANS